MDTVQGCIAAFWISSRPLFKIIHKIIDQSYSVTPWKGNLVLKNAGHVRQCHQRFRCRGCHNEWGSIAACGYVQQQWIGDDGMAFLVPIGCNWFWGWDTKEPAKQRETKSSPMLWLSSRNMLYSFPNSLKFRKCRWRLMTEPGLQCLAFRGSIHRNTRGVQNAWCIAKQMPTWGVMLDRPVKIHLLDKKGWAV